MGLSLFITVNQQVASSDIIWILPLVFVLINQQTRSKYKQASRKQIKVNNFSNLYYKVKESDMNPNNNITFEKSLQLFNKNQKTLPENIRWKLEYISRIIHGQQTQNTDNLPEEYQLEIQDLKDVNQKGLKIIFSSIIQTLFNQEIPIDKQCIIKKKGFFKSWTDGFIKYDDSYIYFNASNKTSRYRFKNIDVELNKSSKRAFDLSYKGEQLMTVKFEKPQSMHAMFKTIKNFILKEKSKYDKVVIERLGSAAENKSKRSNVLEPNKSENKLNAIKKSEKNLLRIQPEKQKSQSKSTLPVKKPKSQYRQKGAMQFERSILSQRQSLIIIRNSKNLNQTTNQLKLNPAPQNYQIRQSSKKMFIALHSKDIKLNLQIILNQHGNLKLNELFSCLCLYRNWNSKIMKQELCYQMKYEQKAIIYRTYEKSSSLLSKPRQTYTILEFKKLSENTALLVEESLDNQDREEQFTRAYLKTIFFIQTHQNTLKICIESEYDPKGFCSQSESQELVLSIYKDITHFETYLSQYSIKRQTSSDDLLFQDIIPQYSSTEHLESPEQFITASQMSRQELEKSSDEEEDHRDNRNSRKTMEIYRRSSKRDPFFQLKPDSPTKIPTLQFIELFNKNEYERYYLKHKFEFAVIKKYDDYIPWYCLEEMLRNGGQYEVTQNLQLKFINQKLIQSQKDILRFLLKQIGANLVSGKSITNVSLPVDIFEPRSLLQRCPAAFSRCPDYLQRICEVPPLEQIKVLTAFVAGIPAMELIMQKPFNPILGETFQCYVKGIPFYCQQTSHHPPISAYFMECPEFKMYGNLVHFADVGLNSGVGGNLGAMHIILKNGYHYECYLPPSQISGLIYGDRKFRCYGRGYVLERSQNLFAEFSIEKQKKGIYQSKEKMLPGSTIGGIFKVNRKFFEYLNSYNGNLKKFPGVSKEHIVQKIAHLNGMWFDKIYINDKLIESARAYPIQYYPYALPSDANFRLDVLYHKQNNLPQSQRFKQILENRQRQDKKLRQKYEKERGKGR